MGCETVASEAARTGVLRSAARRTIISAFGDGTGSTSSSTSKKTGPSSDAGCCRARPDTPSGGKLDGRRGRVLVGTVGSLNFREPLRVSGGGCCSKDEEDARLRADTGTFALTGGSEVEAFSGCQPSRLEKSRPALPGTIPGATSIKPPFDRNCEASSGNLRFSVAVRFLLLAVHYVPPGTQIGWVLPRGQGWILSEVPDAEGRMFILGSLLKTFNPADHVTSDESDVAATNGQFNDVQFKSGNVAGQQRRLSTELSALGFMAYRLKS
ncbi:hypothetical protein BC832DRAFT_540930 [Gaertneriomyces semiglobifer]|nr:hypothetical protein BC832DRAFT_540930 [Gaertneriomyces semiglobifer]